MGGFAAQFVLPYAVMLAMLPAILPFGDEGLQDLHARLADASRADGEIDELRDGATIDVAGRIRAIFWRLIQSLSGY